MGARLRRWGSVVLQRQVRFRRRTRLLENLAESLIELGLPVSFSDGGAAVYIRTGLMIPVLSVTVDSAGAFFEWRYGYNRHPADDPAGTAQRIVAYIKARDMGPALEHRYGS